MLLLTFGVAVLDEHTRFAHLETGTSLLATLGAIVVCHHTFTSYYESWFSWVVSSSSLMEPGNSRTFFPAPPFGDALQHRIFFTRNFSFWR
jgi:hypothetical protein